MGQASEAELINVISSLCGGARDSWVSADEWADALRDADGDTLAALSAVGATRPTSAQDCLQRTAHAIAAHRESAEGAEQITTSLQSGTQKRNSQPATPLPSPAPAPAPRGRQQSQPGVSLEDMDKVFRGVMTLDTYTDMLHDGLPSGDPNSIDPAKTVPAGYSLMEYARACEKGMPSIYQTLLEMSNSVKGQVEEDGAEAEASAAMLAQWGVARLPAEVASILLRWLTHLSRTSSLLSNVVAMLFLRDEARATEHEMQLVDPRGLAVSTVRTPCTTSGWCNLLQRTWLGGQQWVRYYAILWQQFLYLFPSDAPQESCKQCILLRGCRSDVCPVLEGRHNVVCLTNFLTPFGFQEGLAAPRISFERDSQKWANNIRRAIHAPPGREVELLLATVQRQTNIELTVQGIVNPAVSR